MPAVVRCRSSRSFGISRSSPPISQLFAAQPEAGVKHHNRLHRFLTGRFLGRRVSTDEGSHQCGRASGALVERQAVLPCRRVGAPGDRRLTAGKRPATARPVGVGASASCCRSAGEHHLAAGRAAAGTELHHPIGSSNQIEIVLDDYDGIAPVVQDPRERAGQATHVVRMQAYGRLIEDEEN